MKKWKSPCHCNNFKYREVMQYQARLGGAIMPAAKAVICGNCGRHSPEDTECGDVKNASSGIKQNITNR